MPHHRFGPLNLEEYRNKSMKSVIEIQHGEAYIKECLDCGERFSRSRVHKVGTSKFAWYQD